MVNSNPRVPVTNKNGHPLMPTTASRARRWIKSGKATPYFKKGIFCVRLNDDPSATYKQDIACGVDPGGTWEAMTIKSKTSTLLNVQSDAVNHVKKALQARREARRRRRSRNTPYRPNRLNRGSLKQSRISPSTLARWNAKLRLINIWRKIFPISHYIVEDIAAKTKPGKRRWNRSFSPLEVGKNWFYAQLRKLGKLELRKGYETKALRDTLGLTKSKTDPKDFAAHCVDSWVLANSIVGGHAQPDSTKIHYMTSLRFHRRQLHRFQARKGDGDIRRPYGGTISLGWKRGSLIIHSKWGLTTVGGYSNDRLSLHSLETGRRLAQNAKPGECKFLGYNSWRWS